MDESFGKWLSVIHRNLCAYMDSVFPDSDIGHGPRRFLVEIALNPGRTQEEISERLLMDKTTTARAVKQLELRGYITRCRDPLDKRRYMLQPTQNGSNILPLVLSARTKANKALMRGFNSEDIRNTERLLRQMAENALDLKTGGFSIVPEEDKRKPAGKKRQHSRQNADNPESVKKRNIS